MGSKRNHLLYHFSITTHLHLASFYAQNTLKKIARKMLIEQIIEFELRGSGQRRPQKFFQGGASDLSIIYWINQNLTAATRILLRSLNQKLK